MAVYAYPAVKAGNIDNDIIAFFYMGLFAIGMDDWGKDELFPIIMQMGEIYLKCRALVNEN